MDEHVSNGTTKAKKMNSSNPTISIIVPVYNTEQYLPKCLDSIAAQTFTDFEVLMIDDGSTDGSGEICDRYSQSDSRFIVIHQSNQGVSASRNNGLKQARGNYIAFVDSDDYVHPQMLELLYMAIRQGDYDFSTARYLSVNIDQEIEIERIIEPRFRKLSAEEIICNLFGKSGEDVQYMVCWNKLYNKCLLENIYFSAFKVSEDLLFNIEVFSKVCQAIEVDSKLYYYTQRNTSASHSVSEKQIIDRIDASYTCLRYIPSGSAEEACCVTKLYKVLFSSRFFGRKEMYQKNVARRIKEVHKQIYKRFLQSKYISAVYKILFMGFFYCPLLYRVFVGFNELRAKRA